MTNELVRGLLCTNCGRLLSPSSCSYECPACSGILEVQYDQEALAQAAAKDFASSRRGLWRFHDVLPVEGKTHVISLMEGGSPLIKAERLSNMLDVRVYLKDETRNPTGSFKDRPNAVGISKALELGAKTVAVASTGNAAASLSAYAAKAGVTCVVAVPEDVSHSKLNQIMIFGAKVVRVRGAYSDAFRLIKEACKTFGWHNLTSVSSANPYQVEGDKTVAYEICEEVAWKSPDWITIPIGAGPLLVGIWKGFKELFEMGRIKDLPKLIGVQAEGCSPIARAFKQGLQEVSPWGTPHTVARAIADPLVGYSQDGSLTLSRIRESRGIAESVSDGEMIEAIHLLARAEGLFAEPAAAASVAVVKKLRHSGIVRRDQVILPIITGTGLKSFQAIGSAHEPPVIAPDVKELKKISQKC
jgi:threonine synthase